MSARQARSAEPYQWQPTHGDRWEDWEEYEQRQPRKKIRIVSFTRVLLFLLVLIAGAVALYGLFFEQSALQLPLSMTGLGLLAVALLLLSLSLARVAMQLGRRGHGGRAFLAAFLGGLFIIGAAGAGSGAIVLGLLTAL
ncbi:MAG TPA: hypothetical protein VM305_00945 [Candidatus Limnocylindrales bacterium]|nr:hypothetical protein [Candidatus Limnocylindrales bacterium]